LKFLFATAKSFKLKKKGRVTKRVPATASKSVFGFFFSLKRILDFRQFFRIQELGSFFYFFRRVFFCCHFFSFFSEKKK